MQLPHIAVGPQRSSFAVEAVSSGGGQVVDVGDGAEALVWLAPHDVDGLRRAITPRMRWVQLPWAGVEPVLDAGVFDGGRVWTCAKGAYADPVAEHALALALAGLRHLPERIVAASWGQPKGTTLYDADVTILGGGGITTSLLGLLAPFRVKATVVRRNQHRPLPGAAATVGQDQLEGALRGALVVFLALALTPETRGIIDGRALATMRDDAWLVNVARGGHVVTDDLVDALQRGTIAGAALDVTDPEPLPDGHPLWTTPNAIITPHTADWADIVQKLLAERIARNVAHFVAGEPLEGVVDVAAGY
jgi:phosphoglycerate dehydrogenase-like enzyme